MKYSNKQLKELSKAADDCFKNCGDYSCVRSGGCTGFAGHRYEDAILANRHDRKQESEDIKLATQIKRLKSKGLI